jgi:hypothetical protein
MALVRRVRTERGQTVGALLAAPFLLSQPVTYPSIISPESPMTSHPEEVTFDLPEDLAEKITQMSKHYGESPRDLVIAAVEHFTRIPEEQRKAVLRGVSLRRRG